MRFPLWNTCRAWLFRSADLTYQKRSEGLLSESQTQIRSQRQRMQGFLVAKKRFGWGRMICADGLISDTRVNPTG